MARPARRVIEAVVWIVGALFTGVGALIVWNFVTADELDSDPTWFLFGASVYGGSGLLLLRAALRMHRHTSSQR